MQLPERSDRTHFPKLGLLRATAQDFGLADADAVCLDAILYAALSFGAEAEDGAFGCIYLSYGQGEDRVNLTVTGTREDGYRLVLEQAVSGAKDAFKAGLAATTPGVGCPWTVEAVHVAGKPVAAGWLLESIGELSSLVLVAKEVSDRLAFAE